MAAAEVWQLDDVMWMIDGHQSKEDLDKQEKECAGMVDFRQDTIEVMTYLQTALAMKTPCLEKEDVFYMLGQHKKDLEERCHFVVATRVPFSQDLRAEIGNVMATLGLTQILIKHKDSPPNEQITEARAAASAISKNFGLSVKDLAPALRSRFEEFGKKAKECLGSLYSLPCLKIQVWGFKECSA